MVLAGVVVYVSGHVCHVQYCAASAEGKKVAALDLALEVLVARYAQTKRFFDFGSSTEFDGKQLNIGLVDYKERFGARTVAHDFYRVNLSE